MKLVFSELFRQSDSRDARAKLAFECSSSSSWYYYDHGLMMLIYMSLGVASTMHVAVARPRGRLLLCVMSVMRL